MSNYFKNFPKVIYFFGNNDEPEVFQRLSTYSNIIDQFADQASAYTNYEIRDGDRPDALSNRFYGAPEYDFTFFLINEKLREQGWPMTNQQVVERAQSDFFKHYTCVLSISSGDSAAEFADLYPVGTEVLVGNKAGVVVRKNLDIGEIIVSSDSDLTTQTTLSYKNPDLTDPLQVGAPLTNTKYEYEGTHHYENDSAEWLDRWFDNLSGATIVTNLEYLIAQNDAAREIRVLKKNEANQLVGELQRRLAQ